MTDRYDITGLPEPVPQFGGFKETNFNVDQTALSVNVPKDVVKDTTEISEVNGVTSPADGDLLVAEGGLYELTGSICAQSSASGGDVFEFELMIDGVLDQLITNENSTNAHDTVPIITTVRLVAGETINLQVTNITDSSEFICRVYSLYLKKISE